MEAQNRSPVDKKTAAKILWHRGVLTWKLHPVQKELYDLYKNTRYRTVVWSCSRRLGKTYTLSVIAIEECIRKPNSVVKFIAPTTKHVKRIVRPIFKDVLKDCPKDLKPTYNSADHIFKFPNGSEIQLAGTDNGHAESLRGGSSNVCIVDEAGFCDDLRYIVQSILIPTTTTTDGKIILSSTPPKSPDHDFASYYIKEAEYRGSFIKKTIDDNKMLSPRVIKEIEEELGGRNSVEFKREYLCEIIVSEEYCVVPEFTPELQARIIKEVPRPPHYDIYVSGDIGFKDFTVFLFAYYDFRAAKLVIEDELVMHGTKMTTDALAHGIKQKEALHFFDKIAGVQRAPYLRVCDNNLIVINDLHRLHGLHFLPTAKDDKAAALNNMRIMLAAEEIIINPRCKTLIYHLKTATWNKARKSYDRGPDGSHYDSNDALCYMVRNLVRSHNPYPKGFGSFNREDYFDPNLTQKNDTPVAKGLKDIFKIGKRLK